MNEGRARLAPPTELTSLVGRELLVDETRQQLERVRLVTLAGPGGVGKTRLAMEVVRRCRDEGMVVGTAHLADVTTPEGLERAVIGALGIVDQSSKAPTDVLIDHLRDQKALDTDDWSLPDGGGFVLFFPHRRAAFARPRPRLPDSELVWLFDILNVAPRSSGPDFARRMLRRNRRLWDKAHAVGGVRYPIGSLDFGPEDWLDHYGATFEEVTTSKRRFDPAGILTPGPRIFVLDEARPT